MSTLAAVTLWGTRIGAVSLADDTDVATFEYDPAFIPSGIQVSPLEMPLPPVGTRQLFRFPTLAKETFQGLPGLLADSLPDKFGHAVINTWLASQGRPPNSMNAVERLCYVGQRGLGALEFQPVQGPDAEGADVLAVDALVELAAQVLQQRAGEATNLTALRQDDRMQDILAVGTSAGGARAKAIIAWNPATHEVRSGQAAAPAGFEHWLLKLDGLDENRDKEAADPPGYGALEYAYHRMALAAGIDMSPCRLLEENGRRHFMTRRFDRPDAHEKLHMQTLGALAHYDYNMAGAYSYEQAFAVMRALRLGASAAEELFRRMVFNVMARNQDDHVKNIAFLMDRRGEWRLAPAYDLTYSYNPRGSWTSQHQMSVHGKRDHFTRDDLLACGEHTGLKTARLQRVCADVHAAINRWPEFADKAAIAPHRRDDVYQHLRQELF